jgi:hypothetical protein
MNMSKISSLEFHGTRKVCDGWSLDPRASSSDAIVGDPKETNKRFFL